MGSGNWIVDNLNSALGTWNDKLTEIWTLISTSPEDFKGGGIWDVILNIHDALKAIGYALLVLFFVAGVVKTCGSFTELRRPEVAVKTFVRFALAQGAVTYGLELMMALFKIAQGAVSSIMDASGLTAMSDTVLPDEMVSIIEDVGFLESIPLWAVTLLGSLFIWVLSLVMILTVYSRFFKLYMATAIAPIPLASFAGQPSSSIGVARSSRATPPSVWRAVSSFWPVLFSPSSPQRRLPSRMIRWRPPPSYGTTLANWCSTCWCWWARSR